MNPISVSGVITFVITLFSTVISQAQSFGISSSAAWIADCNGSNYYNTTGSGANLIGPAGNQFSNLGTHTRNSATLRLSGGQVRSFKLPGTSNVCGARMYYRVYQQTGAPGPFSSMDLPLVDNCNGGTGQFPSGGSCVTGDQKWARTIPDGATSPYAPVDLTAFTAGNYVLEIYYELTGSSTDPSLCNETFVLNNNGNNYKASFSIQAPVLLSANPVTCNGSEGSITINGLTPSASYSLSYTDDGASMGPLNLTANGSGEITVNGLNAGIYADFILSVNGCATELNTGRILTNPVLVPTFTRIPAFCAGSTPPPLPTTSLNGITGTWTPSMINNQASGAYIFTPSSGQCGIAVTMNITVTPNTVPTFAFGPSLSICAGGSVPVLPNTSSNGVNGSWTPSVADNQNSAVYTFTPTTGQCATSTTFTVSVAPNITPSFDFGNSIAICTGTAVPALPPTANNGITGSWSAPVIDNQNSGSYTFTPAAGQCALPFTVSVTVSPNLIPAFSFGPTLSICAGGAVPVLPTTSDNGISGTWSPAIVDDQASATYTFTPAAGLCALPVTFSVNVTANVTPVFTFGTSLTICAGGTVPVLINTSGNGFTGTWSPAVIDNQNSATYTFTPDAGQCARIATFAVSVNPVITPAFTFGTSLSICAGSAVPTLPNTSGNDITGTWSPATIDNQNSGSYTFTPSGGQCALPVTFTVTVDPVVVPAFSFGATLSVCTGGPVPTLTGTSSNGITGTWSPSIVDNQASGVYTFTPTAGQCAPAVNFTVTINPNITPAFSFGTSLSLCAGGTVPALTTTSTNGIAGTWNPAVVDNQTSGTYHFTPSAGQCATPATFTVTVTGNSTPLFSFGTWLSICAGSTVPVLSTTSTNGISGTWNPSLVNNQASGVYTFTPSAGQCATIATFTVTVTQNTLPTFDFGTSLVICSGDAVPVLPATSTNGIAGAWSPAIVSDQTSGVYTFTPVVPTGQCISSTNFIVTVNQRVVPTFNFGTSLSICSGAAVPSLPATSENGVTGTWSPTTVSSQTSGTYTFTPDAGQCVRSGTTLMVTVAPVATVDYELDTVVNDGVVLPANQFTGSPAGVTFTWTNSNTTIGLAGSGSGNIPGFTASNKGSNTVSGTIVVTPSINGCAGPSKSYMISVNPLDKDVFVPNVFTPNGDGKNDILYAYGNYISKIELRIFNQWGQLVQLINSTTNGWDGRYKGTPQPVGVYVYTLKAVMTDGRTVEKQGNITLLR